jgi:hypothetical protein
MCSHGRKTLNVVARVLPPGAPSLRALVNLGAAHWWLCGAGDGLVGASVEQSLESSQVQSGFSEAVACWQEAAAASSADGAPEQPAVGNACATPTPAATSGAVDEEDADPSPQASALLRASASNSLGGAFLWRAERQQVKQGSGSAAVAGEKQPGVAPDVAAASGAFASALETLQGMGEGEGLGEGPQKELEQRELSSRARRERARALSGLGRCKHRAGQAVTAEGLFRAAIDEVPAGSPLERAAALKGFAALLRDWDGRSGDAAKAESESRALLLEAGLLAPTGKEGIMMARLLTASSMIHVPPLSEILEYAASA